MAGNDDYDTPPTGRIYRLIEQVRSLSEKFDSLRTEITSGRAEFRSEVRGWIERNEADFRRELEKVWSELKDRASASEVEKINNNIRTVVMAIILTVIMAVIGLVIVNRQSVPQSEHASGSAK